MYDEIHSSDAGRRGELRARALYPRRLFQTRSAHRAAIAAVRESHNGLDTTSDSLVQRQSGGSICGMQFTEDNAPR